MLKINLNETAALSLVLTNLSVKELLRSAVVGFSNSGSILEQDKANICSQAIDSFLK